MDKLTRTALQVGVTIAGFAYVMHIVKTSTQEIGTVAIKMQADVASAAAKANADNLVAYQRQKAEQAEATARVQAIVAARQAELAASREADAQAIANHDAAWQRYYKRPKECENPPDYQALVECSNRAIRAREQFEATYKP